MSNGNPHLPNAESKNPDSSFVVYAKESNPTTIEFDEWYGNKREAFGGDDGSEFIPVEAFEDWIKTHPKSKAFRISLTPKSLKI
jgi:hypothetical protein